MSENFTEENNTNEESFEDLFEEYSSRVTEDLQLGDRVSGKVISIGRESVFIDTGTKIDGVVDRAELMDEEGELPCKVGDTLDLYVVFHDGNEIRLSRSLSGIGNLRIMSEAFQKAVPVEGKVKGECKGGFNVEVMGKRAFCPISQMDLKYIENSQEYLGETFTFLISEFDEDGRNIVVSRRDLLKKEQENRVKEFLESASVGLELEGRVTKLMPYGAFVELIPGIEGMVHLSEMAWSRTEKPEEVMTTGESVKVRIIGLEKGKRPEDTKVSLSIKQITGDPWEDVENLFRLGDKVRGKVVRSVRFGAFVEIHPGIEGLVHISEMSYKKRVVKTEDVVTAGETIEVMIKEIDADNRRISLSIRDAEGDPWVDIRDRYSEGQSIEGTIEKKERFGYFVSLEPGITGLLPKSRIDNFHRPGLIERLGQGDRIPVVIERIDLDERRISLAPGDSSGESDWRNYARDSQKPIGSLGEKLQQALKLKN